MLAQRSKELLERYRRGEAVSATCPLLKALSVPTSPKEQLLNFLRNSKALPAAKALNLKRTCQEMVLEYGWWYEPVGSGCDSDRRELWNDSTVRTQIASDAIPTQTYSQLSPA